MLYMTPGTSMQLRALIHVKLTGKKEEHQPPEASQLFTDQSLEYSDLYCVALVCNVLIYAGNNYCLHCPLRCTDT